jgi:serine/threonine-protein kinase RsbW
MATDGRNSTDAVAAAEIRLRADPIELSGLRQAIRRYVEAAGGDVATADDLELVVSELATNVIDHTASPTITITIERTTDAWLIEVADVEDPRLLDAVALPPSSQPTGRGLFVVDALVDHLELVETSTSRLLRCRRRLTN